MINRFGRSWALLFALALYGGPVLAGLAGHAWSVLPVFAALFLFYIVATRKPDLSTGAGWAGLTGMATVQTVLVAAVWAIGIAAAQIAPPVVLPIWAPLAITGVAAGLGAWAWRDAAEMNVMLDSAIKAIEETDFSAAPPAQDPWPEVEPQVRAPYQRFKEALGRLDDCSPAAVDPLVKQLEAQAGAAAFDLLYDDAGHEGEAHDPLCDFAVLRFSALPDVSRALIARGEAGLAPMMLLNSPDERVRAEARSRVFALVEAGAPREQLPDPGWLAELDDAFPGEGFAALIDASQTRAEV